MTTQPETIWLTQATFDKLNDELAWLTSTRRHEIAKDIQEAREDGDLKENAGYHAAKDEQGKIEARIVELESMLKSAEVKDAPEADGVVELGTVVTANIAGREQKFLFASVELESQTDLRVYSPSSPLGQAIEGLTVGATTEYPAPNGKQIPVEILGVETFRA